MKIIKRYSHVNGLAALLLLLTFALLSFERFHAAEIRENNAALEKCIRTFWELLGHKGNGFRIAGGKLLVGTYVINGNFEVPDKVQQIFGGTATVFMGDTRVSTNVLKDDGSRAVGTKLIGPAYDAIFGQGKPFRGETRILGVPYFTAYDPIKDDSGKTIGVLYVGLKKSDFLAHYTQLRLEMCLILLGLLAVFAVFMILLNRLVHKAEQSKEDDLRFLQTLIDAIPTPVFYKDIKGRYLGGNKAFSRLTGFPVERLVGKTVQDILPPDEAKVFYEADQELIRSGGVHVYEATVPNADGAPRNTIFYKAIFPATDGSPGGVIGTVIDITERKRAEDALRQSEEKFSTAFRTSPDAVNLNRLSDGVYLEVNEGFTAITGYEPHEVIGRSSIELGIWVDPRDRARLLDRLRRQGTVRNLEAQFRRKDGTILTGEMSGCIITIDGEPYILNITRDITQHKLADEALQKNEEYLRSLLDAMPVAIYVTDGITIEYINRDFVERFGYDQEDIPSERDWLERAYPDPAYRDSLTRVWMAALDETKRSGAPIPIMEAQVTCKDGRVLHTLANTQLVHNRILIILTDITEREQAQKELLKMQKLESLGVLAGGIAHDFNNILTAILGNVSFAKMHSDETQPVHSPLLRAETACQRAADLARQLLVFAKGGQPVKKAVSPEVIVNEAVTLVLSGTNVMGIIDIPAPLSTINADEGQIYQAFNNIIINAMQSMPDGGRLTVHGGNTALNASNRFGLQAGSYVVISFTDEGCGIPEADQKKIFDPYFTTKAGGSGLGLASTYSIITRHGGQILVSSTVDAGSTFTVYLPVFEKPARNEHPGREAAGRESCGGAILVMDDDEMVRELAVLSLGHAGYVVTTCDNGIDTIELYRAARENGTPYSAVIMDLTIPGGMGGVEAARQIRAHDPAARLIVSSGYSEDPVMANYPDYGFCAAIEKPYKVEEISRLLGSIHEIGI